MEEIYALLPKLRSEDERGEVMVMFLNFLLNLLIGFLATTYRQDVGIEVFAPAWWFLMLVTMVVMTAVDYFVWKIFDSL